MLNANKQRVFIEIELEDLLSLFENKMLEVLSKSSGDSRIQTDSINDLLTRKDAAKMLAISLTTLHDWINKGIIKPYKMGNRTYFRHADLLEKLMDSNKDGDVRNR